MPSQPSADRPNWHARVFFGLHYDLHPNAGDTELGAAATVEHVREELGRVRPDWVQYDCKGHPGYAGYPTRVGTPAPGIVGDALKVWAQVAHDMGIPIAVHYSGTWDDVAASTHPDWARVGPDGRPYGGTICHRSPYVERLMLPMLRECIDWYGIDGVWVDGDCWASRPCWCPRCRRAFADITQRAEADVPQAPDQPHWAEWLAVQRAAFVAYVRRYTEGIHAHRPGCLVCSNWAYTVRMPEPVATPVDWLSGDVPPTFGVDATALEARFLAGRGRPWDLMAWSFFRRDEAAPWTTKPLAHLLQEAATVISQGGAFCVYDVPRRDGHLTRWHQELLAEVAAFVRARQALCQDSISAADAVVLHAPAEHYASNPPLYGLGPAAEAVQGALRALLENGFSADVLDTDALALALSANPRRYALVVVPDAEAPPFLDGYVRAGGRVLQTGVAGAERWGLTPRGALTGPLFVAAGHGAVPMMGPFARLEADADTRVVGSLWRTQDADGEPAGPAALLRRLGEGAVAVVPGPFFTAFARWRYPRHRAFAGDVLGALHVARTVAIDAPPQVELTLRRQPGRLILHLVNRGTDYPLSPAAPAVEGAPPVGPLPVRVRCAGRPAAVRWEPGGAEPRWSWEGGEVAVFVKELRVHGMLVLEGV